MTLLYLVPYTPINFLSKYFLNLDFFVQNFIFLTNFNPFVLNTLGFMWSSLFKFIQAFHFLKTSYFTINIVCIHQIIWQFMANTSNFRIYVRKTSPSNHHIQNFSSTILYENCFQKFHILF